MAAPISDTQTGIQSKSNRQKLFKKLAKIEKSLTAKESIIITKSETQILCVQNGGLGNNVSQEELLPVFSKYGDVECIIMLAQKQYSFVCFKDKRSSARAHEELNGFILRKGRDPSQDVILYLFFVENAPPNVAPSHEHPPGLFILEDFVSETVENSLIELMDLDRESPTKESAVMKHRKVKHFGYEFKYSINDVDVNDPLPDGIPSNCHDFLHGALEKGFVNSYPDQLTINSYLPGQGIPPHVDTREAFEDGIMSLSLGSQVVMDFRHPDGRHLSVLLPRRSLMIMTGESRYVWSHGITPRKSDIVPVLGTSASGEFGIMKANEDSGKFDGQRAGLTLQARERRVSYTFRKVIMERSGKVEAEVSLAGGNTGSLEETAVPQSDTEAVALERKHVNKVYDDIADHFSGTRYKPWPRVVDFLLEQPPLSLLADVGCGNGKCLGVNKDLYEVGSDFSSNLASICHSRGFETCVADVTCLPFRSASFDVVLCIAVIHHMATKNRRLKALSEVVRILQSGGKALVYVWAMEQELNKAQSKYIKPGRQKKQHQQQRELEGDSQKDLLVSSFCSGEESALCEEHEQRVEESGSRSGLTVPVQDEPTNQCLPSDCRLNSSSDSPNCCFECPSVKSEDNRGTSDNCSSQLNIRHVTDSSASHEETGQHTVSSSSGDNCLSCEADAISQTEQQKDKKLSVHVNRTQFKDQDLLVPWQLKDKNAQKETSSAVTLGPKGGNLFHRFYHVFRQGELEAICKRVPGCVVEKSYYDQGNWCVVLRKL